MTLGTLHTPAIVAMTITACLVAAPAPAHGQTTSSTMPAASIAVSEAAAIAQYWVLLAEGKFDEAAKTVSNLARQYPRSVAALTLLVETDIARGGASTALESYEIWLNGRALDEPGVLRRIARAVLYEWARQTNDNGARNAALEILARDGDADAVAAINAILRSGSEAAQGWAFRLGDPAAIEATAAKVRASKGLKLRELHQLSETGSPAAVPVLIETLRDPSHENRAAAADALGKIGGADAANALRSMLGDPHGIVRTSVAAALFRLGDFSGAAILNELAASEHSSIRRTAAMLMATQPDEAWKALVRSLLTDEDWTIRLDAARMLAPHEPEAARLALAALSANSDIAAREATELVLAELPTTSLVALRALMRSGGASARVRAAGRVLVLTR